MGESITRCRAFVAAVTVAAAMLADLEAGARPTAPATEEPASRAETGRPEPPTSFDERRCRDCHPRDPLFSHPVDVEPIRGRSTELPLIAGRVGCLTCHEPPSAEHGLGGRSAYLRTGDTAGLCRSCHDPRSQNVVDLHALGLGRAHLQVPGTQASGDPGTPTAGIGGLDVESTTCLGCHDGVVAAGGSILVASGLRPITVGLTAGPSIDHSHPIGMPYEGSRRDVGLRRSGLLDERIRLVHDRVSCGSCHSPFSREDNRLVMSNTRSRLCLACHEY